MGPKSNHRCLFKRETRKGDGRGEHRHTEKKAMRDRGRDWSDVATDQASQRILGNSGGTEAPRTS